MSAVDTGLVGRPERFLGQSLVVSAVRCALTYIVFPFVLPVVGITAGLHSSAGLILGALAVTANALSIRRFWAADHARKVAVSMLNMSVIVLLLVLMVQDANNLSL